MKTPHMLIWAGEEQGAVRVEASSPYLYHTIALYTHDFEGSVLIEGSIENEPTDSDWYEIFSEAFERPLRDRINIQNRVYNHQGRTIWMRATVNGVYGRVDRVLVL